MCAKRGPSPRARLLRTEHLCALPTHMLKDTLQGDGIRGDQVIGVEPSRMGFMPILKRAPRKLPCPFCQGQNEKTAVCEPEAGPRQTPNLQAPWLWDFPDPRTVRNQSVVYKPPQSRVCCYSSQNRLRQRPSCPRSWEVHSLIGELPINQGRPDGEG